MVRIQYLSDVHLEHHKPDRFIPETWITPDPTADLLVLAGDIGWPEKPNYEKFIAWCSERWPAVVVVAGNHEFYGEYADTAKKSRYEKLELIRHIVGKYPNVRFLQQEAYQLKTGVWVLGCTLWSDIPSDMWKYAVDALNDFRMIRATDAGEGMTIAEYNALHLSDRRWLDEQLSMIRLRGEKAIVVTHHMPSFNLIHRKFEGLPMNCCFGTDLETMIQVHQPLAWICGHSHAANKMTIGSTQLALNPNGYPGERVETRTRIAVLELDC
jgi:predicted phosphohydrolase